MKQNRKQYVVPMLETMNCKVEHGFECSSADTYCDGQLEGLTESETDESNLFL